MKNFRKLTLGVLTVASLGLTSCVDDTISDEVKQIYTNQAGYIAAQSALAKAQATQAEAQASLVEAEAAYQNALAAYQNAQTESQILDNEKKLAEYATLIQAQKDKLELANLKHQQAIIDYQNEVKEANIDGANDYLGKYSNTMADIIDNNSEISEKKSDLAELEADSSAVFDKDRAVELAKFDVVRAENSVEENKARLETLEAILADPSSVGAQVIALDKQVEETRLARDEKERRRSQITPLLTDYSTALGRYNLSVTNVNNAKVDIVDQERAIASLEASKLEKVDEVSELSGGTVSTLEEATDFRNTATDAYDAAVVLRDELLDKYNDELDVLAELNNLDVDYANLIGAPGVVGSLTYHYDMLNNATTTKATLEGQLSTKQSEYDVAKAIYDANPLGNTATANPDGQAGQLDNGPSEPNTYYKITAVGTPGVPSTYTFDLSVFYITTTIGSVPGAVIGDNVGEWFDVEADDAPDTNANLLRDTSDVLINLKEGIAEKEAEILTSNERIAELEAKKAEIEAAFAGDDLSAQHTIVVEARKDYEDQADLVDTTPGDEGELFLAKMKGDDVFNIMKITIPGIDESIRTNTLNLENTKERLAFYESEVTRLESLINSDAIDGHEALRTELSELGVAISLDNDKIDALRAQIVYLNALDVSANSHNPWWSNEDTINNVKSQILDQKEAVVSAEKGVQDAKNELDKLKQEKVTALEYKAKKIAKLTSEIAILEAENVELAKLAAKYKELMDALLAA